MRWCWALLMGCLMMVAIAQQRVLYVAPNGDDRWSGALPRPNRARSDGPLRTLQTALQRVLEGEPMPTEIRMRGGVYWLQEPVVVTPAHALHAQRQLRIVAVPASAPFSVGDDALRGGASNAGASAQYGLWNCPRYAKEDGIFANCS